jgi:N6-L-threonylcarbamoyladenine synthase
VVDVLVHKARRAASLVGANTIALGGGVAANSLLRSEMTKAGESDGIPVVLPSREMCTDNAAMIASAGWYRLRRGEVMGLDAGADPNLKLGAGQR